MDWMIDCCKSDLKVGHSVCAIYYTVTPYEMVLFNVLISLKRFFKPYSYGDRWTWNKLLHVTAKDKTDTQQFKKQKYVARAYVMYICVGKRKVDRIIELKAVESS